MVIIATTDASLKMPLGENNYLWDRNLNEYILKKYGNFGRIFASKQGTQILQRLPADAKQSLQKRVKEYDILAEGDYSIRKHKVFACTFKELQKLSVVAEEYPPKKIILCIIETQKRSGKTYNLNMANYYEADRKEIKGTDGKEIHIVTYLRSIPDV